MQIVSRYSKPSCLTAVLTFIVLLAVLFRLYHYQPTSEISNDEIPIQTTSDYTVSDSTTDDKDCPKTVGQITPGNPVFTDSRYLEIPCDYHNTNRAVRIRNSVPIFKNPEGHDTEINLSYDTRYSRSPENMSLLVIVTRPDDLNITYTKVVRY